MARSSVVRAVDALLRHTDTTAIYVTHCLEEIPPFIRNVLRLRIGRAQTCRFAKDIAHLHMELSRWMSKSDASSPRLTKT